MRLHISVHFYVITLEVKAIFLWQLRFRQFYKKLIFAIISHFSSLLSSKDHFQCAAEWMVNKDQNMHESSVLVHVEWAFYTQLCKMLPSMFRFLHDCAKVFFLNKLLLSVHNLCPAISAVGIGE